MNKQSVLGVIIGITLVTVGATTPMPQSEAFVNSEPEPRKAPPAITGDNVYVVWMSNNTSDNNEDIMFRASTDGGATFGEAMNLSNSTGLDSTRVEIDSDADSVVVTWWETNQHQTLQL